MGIYCYQNKQEVFFTGELYWVFFCQIEFKWLASNRNYLYVFFRPVYYIA